MEATRIAELEQTDFVAQYLTSIAHHSPRTISTYRDILHMLQNRFGGALESAEISELLKLLESLGAHYQQDTMNVIRAVLLDIR